jgi:hypothetical protein
VAFTIRVVGGYQPVPAELVGAAVVIAALIYANLAGRRLARRQELDELRVEVATGVR